MRFSLNEINLHAARFLQMILITALLVSAGCRKEDNDAPPKVPGYVTGTVTNQFAQPLAGLTVSLKGNDVKKTFTDNSGNYHFSKIPWTAYTLSVSAKGYLSQSKSFTCSSADTLRVDLVLQPGEAFTSLSDSILYLPYTSGATSIRIGSNTSWTITNTSGWIVCNPAGGQGNDTVLVTWPENTGTEIRSCTLVLNDGTRDHPVIIRQGFKLLLTGTGFSQGNDLTGEADSITLTYNQPVKDWALTEGQWNCSQALHMRYLDDSSSVRFNYPCGRLGGEYQFEYTVKDVIRNRTTGTAKVPFYAGKITLAGQIASSFITDDNTICWVAVKFPGRLVAVSLKSHTVIRTISLPYNPVRVCMNPWDQKLYLTATDPANNRYDSAIYVINPTSGATDRIIRIQRDQYDVAQEPSIFPYALQFTATGYGAVLLHSVGYYHYRWKVIDCAQGDSISVHPNWLTVPDFYEFKDVFLSHDKQKLLMTSRRTTCNIATLDGSTHKLHILTKPPSCDLFIRPNRLNGNIWLAQAYHQNILHPDNSSSLRSDIDLENNPGGDFTYRANEPEVLYVCADNIFQMFDYSTGKAVMKTTLQYNLQAPMTTTNGEQLIMIRSADSNSDILFFVSSIFRTAK